MLDVAFRSGDMADKNVAMVSGYKLGASVQEDEENHRALHRGLFELGLGTIHIRARYLIDGKIYEERGFFAFGKKAGEVGGLLQMLGVRRLAFRLG